MQTQDAEYLFGKIRALQEALDSSVEIPEDYKLDMLSEIQQSRQQLKNMIKPVTQ